MKVVFRDDDGGYITDAFMESVPRASEVVNIATYPATGMQVHNCIVLYVQYNTATGHKRPIEIFVSGWGRAEKLLPDPNMT